MSYVAVTLETGREKLDLALPMQVPSRMLAEALVEKMGLSQKRGFAYVLSLKTEHGLRPLPANANLADAGVLHGAILTLLSDERLEEKSLPDASAFLRAEGGGIFPVAGRVTLIGRTDPKSGIFVDVDLSPLLSDPKIVSRRHAQIEQEGDHFYVTDLNSVNGTKLNGERLPPKERKPLWDGDTLEVGRNGARLTFVRGKK